MKSHEITYLGATGRPVVEVTEMSAKYILENARVLVDAIYFRLDEFLDNGWVERMRGGGYSITIEAQPTYFINIHFAPPEGAKLAEVSFHYFENDPDDGGFTQSSDNPSLWFTYLVTGGALGLFEFNQFSAKELADGDARTLRWDQRLRRLASTAGLQVAGGVVDGGHNTGVMPPRQRRRGWH